MITTTLFDDARRKVAIEDLAAKVTKLKGSADRRGECPLCHAAKPKGGAAFADNPPFSVKPKTGKWVCYVCGEHGDVVDLEARLSGVSLAEAARRLLGDGYAPQAREERAAAPAVEPSGPSANARIAEALWSEATSIAPGRLAWGYLAWRGISETVIARAAPRLRFHPRAKHHWDDDAGGWVTAPAMLVRPETPAGPTGGVHATYLRADARLLGKRMWGPQNDAQGRPGGAWLIGPEGAGDLATGEGIETVLSIVTLAEMRGESLRAVAALSLLKLQGGVARDAEGAIDVWNPQPDPALAPFTWPQPEPPWSEIIIGVDHDMKPLKVKGRTGRGRLCPFTLDAEARARICGRLAVAAWRHAGAPVARAVTPGRGLDFNDKLQRILAERAV